MRKTKLIFTIGPVSENEETLSKLIEAGMNASRHNFSHGDHEEHRGRIELVKKLSKKYDKSIAVILDTKGPEIRTGDFEKGSLELQEGAEFTLVCGEEVIGDETQCSVTYDNLYSDVIVGTNILINDGLIALEVKWVEGNKIHCIVKNSGTIGNHKNMNVPGASINLPAITQKDIDDLKFGIEVGVDIIAASFIRKASDVLEIRKVLEKFGGSDILIFSKIENQEGVNNIDEIIKFSDGIMVARGDLGVEIPIEQVPLTQKKIIEKCNRAGKPVITATQMLDSMIRNPRPTRAEASDIANAIFDGTDAIMLSGETANGKYPIEAAKTMAKIAEAAENNINYSLNLKRKSKAHLPSVPNAISLATCNTAMELNASAIITATQSGHTARMVSKYRPECPVIAATPYDNVARKLALNWGVFPIITDMMYSTDELVDKSVEKALQTGFVRKGDLVVIAAGIPINYAGTTNMMKVHIVGDILVQGKGTGTLSAFGTCNVVSSVREARETLEPGEILVLKEFTVEYLQVLNRVQAVITEDKQVVSDLAVECISREIPLIYAAENATEIIKSGSFITMDVQRGIVYSGKASIK